MKITTKYFLIPIIFVGVLATHSQAADPTGTCTLKDKKTGQQVVLKNETAAAPILAEWDRIFASFEDFYGPIGLYSNVDPDEALRKAAEDCEIKISQIQTDVYQNPKLYQQIKKIKIADPIEAKFREDILEEEDGPVLQHGLKGLHNSRLILPSSRSHYPSRDALDWRYSRFMRMQ